MNEIITNRPFVVTVCGRSYNAICLSSTNGEGYDKNVIKNTDNGEVWTVEDLWFDSGFSGRKIKYI